MELPRLIVIGEKNINEFGKFLRSLNNPKKVSLVSGIHVKKFIQKKIKLVLLKKLKKM
jgi:glycerol-1-phosphate dehydrogenase [NAD(P)+]